MNVHELLGIDATPPPKSPTPPLSPIVPPPRSPTPPVTPHVSPPTATPIHHQKKPELGPFLLELLQSNQHPEVIDWTGDVVGEFKIHDTKKCAELWGKVKKNKKEMNYDKMSRGLRFYYEKKTMRKTKGRDATHKYCFITNATSNDEISTNDLKSNESSPNSTRRRSKSSDATTSSDSRSPPNPRVAAPVLQMPNNPLVQFFQMGMFPNVDPNIPVVPVVDPTLPMAEQLQQMQDNLQQFQQLQRIQENVQQYFLNMMLQNMPLLPQNGLFQQNEEQENREPEQE